jgi:hypothetical protein
MRVYFSSFIYFAQQCIFTVQLLVLSYIFEVSAFSIISALRYRLDSSFENTL